MMEGILHRTVTVNGINMHIAEKGEGPLVLLIHGFPELWYCWRHQILGLAARGYRAVAPDMRGYGDTDAPPSASSYTAFHIVGDLVALIDALGQDQVFVVGHDWGAMMAWYFCLFRPDRVKALVNLSVAFRPRHPSKKPVETMKALLGENYYICRFQEPGVAEADFARLGTSLVLKKLLTYRRPAPFILPEGGFSGAPDKQFTLPSWLSEEDINYYASKFEKTGFTGGLNYYRALDLNWELTAPWTGVQVKVPVMFIVGDLDLTYNTLGAKEYIHNGGFKKDVPFLQELIIMEGVGHFLNQERPDEITAHIYDFIRAQVKVAAKYIVAVGDLDLNYYMMGTKEYINSGLFKKDVPNLKEVVVIEGVAHFMHLERPDEITAHILDFIQKHLSLLVAHHFIYTIK